MSEGTSLGRKVAVVTGGCRNLGLDISRALVSIGFVVIATTRDRELSMEPPPGLNGIYVMSADVSKEGGVRRTFARVRRTKLPLGVLVNNASSFPRGPLMSLSSTEVREAMESTYISSFMCCREAVPMMKGIGWGRVINIGMAGAENVRGYREVAAHASAKTALAVLTLSLASELEGTGITVNMVSPGPIEREDLDHRERERLTGISPVGRMTRPEDVARRVIGLVEGDVSGSISTVL